MSALVLAYALYCAYRDRHKTRARRGINPYSYANLLERNWREAQQERWISQESAVFALRMLRGND